MFQFDCCVVIQSLLLSKEVDYFFLCCFSFPEKQQENEQELEKDERRKRNSLAHVVNAINTYTEKKSKEETSKPKSFVNTVQ